jgi:glycosyltransferase involved in cell wall biosynthesis
VKLLVLYETVYPDFIGGVELRNYELAAALGRRGHEVTLAGFCGGLTTSAPGLRIVSLGELGGLYNSSGKRSTRQALRFARAVARLDLAPYDLVETANMPYVHLLPLAARCAAARQPLLVTWYEYWGAYWHGYVGHLRAPAYRAVELLTAQLGTAVAATSDLTRGRLTRARRLLGRRAPAGRAVELLPGGITVSRVRAAAAGAPLQNGPLPGGIASPQPSAAAGTPRASGTAAKDGPPLIYAGRLLEHKRLDLLLGAVAILAAHECGGPGSLADDDNAAVAADIAGDSLAPLLTVFGEGPDRPRLERLAAELGIAGRVRFRGHVQSSEEVWQELGRALLAVQPSAREGFGLFPLEAMAAGLPVVYCTSPESAVGELVRDGIEGVATSPEAGALAAALRRLLQDAAERRRLAQNAGSRAEAYDWDEIAERTEQLCAALISRRPR